MPRRRASERPEVRYAEAVLEGKELASRWVRLAAERHLRDLRTQKRRGLRFVPELADTVFDFWKLLRHSKGNRWAGKVFEPEPWQQFLLGSLFGWTIRETGFRRFRVAYIEVPRKNGKSTLGAGVGTYLFAGDGEEGAEVYFAATKRDQAKIAFLEARRMVLQSPELREEIGVYAHNLHILGTASKCEPLGADTDSIHGLNISGAVVDEVHAHKKRDMWDVITTGTGSREQPLVAGITTAGFDRTSVCWEQREHAVDVLQQTLEDDTFFAYIATLDPCEEHQKEGKMFPVGECSRCDDWRDERTWKKANPNLDVSCSRDDLRAKVERAQSSPAAQNAVLRLHFNIWTEQEDRLIAMDLWEACEGDLVEADLEGRKCFGGLDLASTIDTTSLALYFPETDDELAALLWWFWVPADTVQARVQRDRVPYDRWRDDGWVLTTEGSSAHYPFIRRDINEIFDRHDVAAIGFDPHNADQLRGELEDDGITMVKIPQSYEKLATPTDQLLRMLRSQEIQLERNPVAHWQASNVAGEQNAEGHVKPSRKKSREKIDGIAAAVMAIHMAQNLPEEGEGSVYDERDGVTVEVEGF